MALRARQQAQRQRPQAIPVITAVSPPSSEQACRCLYPLRLLVSYSMGSTDRALFPA